MALPTGIRYLSGRIRWEASYKGKRAYGTADTIEEAVRAREQAREALRTNDKKLLPKRYAPPPTTPKKEVKPEPINQIPTNGCTTLQEMVQFLMQTEWRSSKSIRTTRINAATVINYFGADMRLADITSASIDGFTSHLLQRGLTNGTINRKLAILSKVLKKAALKNYILAAPYIQRLPESEGRVRYLTVEEEVELLTLLKHLGKVREHDAVIILIDTGMRTGELFKLCQNDIDLQRGSHGVVHLYETKNGESRGVPLTLRAKEALLRLIAQSNDPERLLPVGDSWLRNTWDRAKHILGYDDDEHYIPHILRHTCCSRLVQRGAPLKKVQAWMGHKSIQTTMRYAHLCPADLYNMTDLLESMPT